MTLCPSLNCLASSRGSPEPFLRKPVGTRLAGVGAVAASLLATSFPAQAVLLSSTYALPSNEWHQIVIPAALPIGQDTLGAVLADDMLDEVGDPLTLNSQWAVFSFQPDEGGYRRLAAGDRLTHGLGYWILQLSGEDVTLDLPVGASVTTGVEGLGCELQTTAEATAGDPAPACVRVPLANSWPGLVNGWSMVGKPSLADLMTTDVRVVTTQAELCDADDDCTLADSEAAALTDDIFHTWNPVTGIYDLISGSDPLPDWTGLWLRSVDKAPSADAYSRAIAIPVASTDALEIDCACDYLQYINDGALAIGEIEVPEFDSDTGELVGFELQSTVAEGESGPLTLGDLFEQPLIIPGLLGDDVNASTPFEGVRFDTRHDYSASDGERSCGTSIVLSTTDLDADGDSAALQVLSLTRTVFDDVALSESPNATVSQDLHNACANNLLNRTLFEFAPPGAPG